MSEVLLSTYQSTHLRKLLFIIHDFQNVRSHVEYLRYYSNTRIRIICTLTTHMRLHFGILVRTRKNHQNVLKFTRDTYRLLSCSYGRIILQGFTKPEDGRIHSRRVHDQRRTLRHHSLGQYYSRSCNTRSIPF